ncbi:FtsX-like permease family protein [Spirosoma taeanense]|uniref:FtsX-like permease family protein n=1 Tax=Spirosoma taeanense TaxID=2735870 RepID=A0A6M5Y849_9BACT|nr:FtsX-like permease family protein [Spirosoma taeanense]QJW89674.1 FtsX-like permease family protein [Spirosoma taeanense]
MFTNYLKIAWRNLRTQRSYTLLNTVGLSIGMAGGLLIFLFLRHHLSTDRHHARFDHIYRIDTDLYLADSSIEYNAEAPLPMAQVLRTQYPQVEQAAFLSMVRDMTVSVKRSDERQPTRFLEHKGTGLVEPEWFDVLSYTWLRGDAKTALRGPNRVVLTESWARKYFGDTDPVGQTLTLNNKAIVTVTGLLAEPPVTTDTNLGLFVSMSTMRQLDPEYDVTDWGWLTSSNRLYATLKSEEAAASLQQAMPALARKQYGDFAKVYHFVIQPMRELHFDVARDPGGAIRSSLLWSLGIVGLLLILASCINFINLATAQALRRSKEVGIRKTLGSSRGQLSRQFLLETALVTLAATSLALLLTYVSLPLFNNWVQLGLTFRLDGLTVVFIALLFFGVVLLAGGYPAAVLSGFSPDLALRGKLTTSSFGGLSVRRVLVVTQFIVCQALIVGALVVARQVQYMQQADLGFRPDNVVLVPLPDKTKPLQDAFKQELSQYADIRAVSLGHLPPSSDRLYGGSVKFEKRPDWEPWPTRERLADADFVKTYQLKLVAGRNIIPSDTIREYLINETMLHKLGFQKPEQILGKRLQHYLSPVMLPIVGVVRDFHLKSLREEIGPCVIASLADRYRHAGIRISGRNPSQTLERIRQTWQQLYPSEVFEYQFLDEHIARLYKTETLITRLVNVFAGLAILICCLGLYGLVSQVVEQRTKEIGIRKVLGASVASIVALLSKDFLRLVLIAIVIASPIAWYVMNGWLQEFVYRIDIAWWVFALAGILAVSIALLTVSFQSIKAALTNPVNSLRSE